MSKSIHFSWRALILAPLVIPLVLSALLTIASPGKSPAAGFLFFLALGSILSYGTTIFLFLPGLFVISRFTPLTASLTGFLGTALGLVVYGPVIWVSYGASGDDSGPPAITFFEYLGRHGLGLDFWVLLGAGLITALLYWFLAKQSAGKDDRDRGTVGDGPRA